MTATARKHDSGVIAELKTGDWCYWVPEDQDPSQHGGYVPSLVIRGKPGHQPMTGDPEKLQAPWVWGATLEAAQEVCTAFNARMGIDAKAALRIVDSSIAAQLRRRRPRRGDPARRS